MGGRQRAGHLFGPLLRRSPNPRFLHGPSPVGHMDRRLCLDSCGLPVADMDWPLCLDSCGLGVSLVTSGPAALMSCTSPCVFCCISHHFAFRGRSVTLLMDHGTMSHLLFGLIKATRPPRKMKERMRQMCVPCVVRSAPPSQLVVSARSIIVMNVLMPTVVENKLFIRRYMSNTHEC